MAKGKKASLDPKTTRELNIVRTESRGSCRKTALLRARPWLHQILTPVPNRMRDVEVTGSNQVWMADITYVPMRKGFLYLVASDGLVLQKGVELVFIQ